MQRQLFSAHHAGKAWHALAGVKTLEPGEGLVGLRVDPAVPKTCDVILWPPQPQLQQLANPPETAPIASVLPQNSVSGTLVHVNIRLWDAEGNASTPFLQYQLPSNTNWQDATNAHLDGVSYNLANKVAAPPGGSNYVLIWDARAICTTPGPTNLWFRARAQDMTLVGIWSAPMPYTLTVPTDSDGDGLPDDWEQEKLHTLAYGPNDDPDHDGFTNLEEYLADTHPNDGQSYLGLIINGAGTQVEIQWYGGVQATQYLQRRLSLEPNDIWQDIFTNPPPTPITNSYLDLIGTNAMQFYRVRISR